MEGGERSLEPQRVGEGVEFFNSYGNQPPPPGPCTPPRNKV